MTGTACSGHWVYVSSANIYGSFDISASGNTSSAESEIEDLHPSPSRAPLHGPFGKRHRGNQVCSSRGDILPERSILSASVEERIIDKHCSEEVMLGNFRDYRVLPVFCCPESESLLIKDERIGKITAGEINKYTDEDEHDCKNPNNGY